MQALLALEDGRIFKGVSFGATGTVTGEICFNTSMTGYQEILTDPSYRGQIVAMTYPLIGNYGVNAADEESYEPHVRGFVIEELSEISSNWRSEGSLVDYLKEHNIPGIQGIDTRSLTVHLRDKGAMKSCITTEDISDEEAVKLAKESTGVVGMDFVREVSTKETYEWDPESTLSREWTIVTGPAGIDDYDVMENGQAYRRLEPAKYDIVAFDLGMKTNILRMLRREGFRVTVVPASTTAEEVLALNPEGVFFSNGPGDPSALEYVHQTARELMQEKPVFGICLGHQMLSHAVGGKTFKLKFGHRGANQPVKDLISGKVSITSQNHGFAVDPDSLPDDVEVTHVNLNDNTVAGMRHKQFPVFSVQYHPEASPGPHDASYFFKDFAKLIEENRNS